MSLDSVSIEKLVRNRLPYLSTADDEVVGEFKYEVYNELGPVMGILEADTEDDSKYSNIQKSLIADIVGCYMLFNRSVQTVTGIEGKITSSSFAGAGLDDAVFSGIYTGAESAIITVEVDSVGGTDTFKWKKDGGVYTTLVDMTGGTQLLIDGVIIKFAATTGHTLGDIWIANAVPGQAVTGKVLTKAKAGSTEVEWEQLKGGGSGNNGATSIKLETSQLLNALKKSAYRKGRSLGFIIDICEDCSIAIESLSTPPNTPFIVCNFD